MLNVHFQANALLRLVINASDIAVCAEAEQSAVSISLLSKEVFWPEIGIQCVQA